MISIKILLVISMHFIIGWWWELRRWSHKIQWVDTSTTSRYYFYRKRIGTANGNLNFDIRVSRVKSWNFRGITSRGLTLMQLLHGHFVEDCIVLVMAVFYFLKCQNWCCALSGLDPVGKWEYNYLVCRIDINLRDPSCGFINLLSKLVLVIKKEHLIQLDVLLLLFSLSCLT